MEKIYIDIYVVLGIGWFLWDESCVHCILEHSFRSELFLLNREPENHSLFVTHEAVGSEKSTRTRR